MTDRRPAPQVTRLPGSARDRVATVSFSDLLRRYRLAVGLTQEELAERATVSARAVSDLERAERRRPQRETLRLLADALDLTDDDRGAFEAAARRSYPAPPRLVRQPTPPSNLPTALTPLVGRADDVAAIVALLREPAIRLVTITGAGGVGKTRFVLDAAARALPMYPDGGFFVALAAINDPTLLLAAIAQTFGIKERGTRGVRASLIATLASRRLLLVLDNFEHLLAAAGDVADLLISCPDLTVLVTSRAALHLRGEHEYHLRPLALPAPGDADELTKVRQSPAVELFMQRATAINRDLVLDRTNAAAIARICQRLDGLPLALELAAARTRVLQPAELLARLDDRFAVLTDGAHDLPARQQTMRHAIDWSYHLLPNDERRLFRLLSVFAGGCTVEAAEAVAGAVEGQSVNLLSALSSLVDKSLLSAEAHGGATRFTMLETVRAYGYDCLAEAGEIAAAQRAHAVYFLGVARAAGPDVMGEPLTQWLTQMDAEFGNLRAALVWARNAREAEIGVRLAAAVWWYWNTRGYHREGRGWIATMLALDCTNAAPASDRALALRGAATMALWQADLPAAERDARASAATCQAMDDAHGTAAALNILGNAAFERNDYHEAIARHSEALTLRRAIGDRRGASSLLGNMGRTARFMGDYERAASYFREGEPLKRELEDARGLASNLGNQGHMARDCGDPVAARPLIEESLACYEQLGEKRGMGIALAQLAMIACDTGDTTGARTCIERSLAIRQRINDRWGIAQSLNVLGDIARATGDNPRAWSAYRDALAIYAEIGNRLGVTESIERLAQLMTARQQWAEAARCFGAANAVREEIGAPILPVDRPAIEQAIARARAALGDTAWAAAFAAGRVEDIGAIVRDVLAQAHHRS